MLLDAPSQSQQLLLAAARRARALSAVGLGRRARVALVAPLARRRRVLGAVACRSTPRRSRSSSCSLLLAEPARSAPSASAARYIVATKIFLVYTNSRYLVVCR